MEKKAGNRSNQPPAKGLAVDSSSSKKSQDGKLWPKGSRRREPTGGSLASKCEPVRNKPSSQRTNNKTFDKRPRSRNYPTQQLPSIVDRAETTGLDEPQSAELGSVILSGSKKQNLNHLLNFSYSSPRSETNSRYGADGLIGNRSSSNRLLMARKYKYSKEHFLQANCQFVVNASGDYKQYVNNPDALVDWNFIEQVNVQVSEHPSCPICLYPPVAAKITRCGHIYCWSCLLHYLALSDNTSRLCPICYESIYKQDLKTVVSVRYETFNVNDTITFRLMKRGRGSSIAYPSTATMIKDDNRLFNMSEDASNDVYSKLLLANESDIIAIINREFDELNVQLIDNGVSCPENCFVDEALALLEERRNRIIFNDVAVDNSTTVNRDTSNSSEIPTIDDLNLDSLDISLDHSINLGQQKPMMHYFYQASGGQHIYLHAINARMLEHTYGSLEFAPKVLTGKILERNVESVTVELRKKRKYLQNLPVTCQFEVAEIQLRPPTVSEETYQEFLDQIESRRRDRQHRAKEEKRREKRIAAVENRLMGRKCRPIVSNLHIDSTKQFPSFEPRHTSESDDTNTISPSGSLNTENNEQTVGPSFAKMLTSSSTKTATVSWPVLKSSEPPSIKLINVTGSKMKTSSFVVDRSSTSNNNNQGQGNSDDEFAAHLALPPAGAMCLADAFDVALLKTGRKKKNRKNKF